MNLAVIAIAIITFIMGLAAGCLIVYTYKQDYIDWLIVDYERRLEIAKETITRLDAINSERQRTFHCTPIEKDSLDWEELTFKDDIDFPNSRGKN